MRYEVVGQGVRSRQRLGVVLWGGLVLLSLLPLAQARQIGNTIYVSGQVAYDPNGNLVGEGDMRAQTRQVFDNIRAVLAAAGARLEDIVKINTYITDQSRFMDMLDVRREIFGANPPASTAVVVSALAFPGLLIEVEAIAVKA